MDRSEIFKLAAKKLLAEFNELSSVPHSALKGHEAEDVVRRFLRDHLPRRYDVGSGFILDQTGDVSPQTDVVIYDAFNCPVYRASPDAAIFPSNNVAAVIEVKSRLTKAELLDAAKKAAKIKSLRKHIADQGPFVSQTYCVLFAFAADTKLSTLLENYKESIRENGLGRHMDLVCVLDKGLLTLAARPLGSKDWGAMFMEGFGGTAAEGSHIAVSAAKFGDNTLDAFFRLLLIPLMMFRGVIDHPGFGWESVAPQGDERLLIYLTSITNESNPVRREAKLAEYAQQIQREFDERPWPKDWDGA